MTCKHDNAILIACRECIKDIYGEGVEVGMELSRGSALVIEAYETMLLAYRTGTNGGRKVEKALDTIRAQRVKREVK